MDMQQQIEEVLEKKIRPMLHSHGGEVQLIAYEAGVVHVELLGACAGCPSADLDTKAFIEDTLRSDIPGVESVELVETTSAELLDFARELLNGK